MSVDLASPERLSEVLRLATALADRALDAQITGRPISADQAVALAKAARLLQDHGVEWPPLLTQVLHDLPHEDGEDGRSPMAQPSLSDAVARNLSRFFTRAQPETGEP